MKITSVKNSNVRKFRELIKDKRLRDSENSFVAEGDHLCGEAAKSGLKIRSVMATQRAAEKYPETFGLLTGKSREYFVITEQISEYISDTKSPQGIFAEFEKPETFKPSGNRLVILDGVQDPANVGGIIRTSEALGIGGVIMSGNCADIYSPKTLRSSMGSVFRLPCITGDSQDIINLLKSEGYVLYASVLDDKAEKLGETSFPEKAAVVIGSEGAGISEKLRKACQHSLYIPINITESLNAGAAAAIIIWELSSRGVKS